MRGGGEHRFDIVLLARSHGLDALAAAALCAVLDRRQALDIAVVREGVDAVLLLDEVLDVDLVLDVLDLGLALVAVLFADLDQLVLEHALDLFGVGEQLLEVGNALLKLAVLVLQLLAVETLERFQAHVQYRLRLHVGQAEALHQVLLCVVVAVADDVDNLVDVILRDEQTLQQVGALLGLFQVVFRSAHDQLFLEGEVLVDDVAQVEYLRLGLVVYQRQHVYRKARLHLGLRQQAVEHDLRICVAL